MERFKIKRIVGGRGYEREITAWSRVTSSEAATMIGLTLRHLYRLIRLKKLHPTKKGGHLFFKYKEIQKFMNERR